MKKVAIVADNYKLKRFRKKLAEKGITDIEESPFTEDTTAMTMRVEDHQVKVVHKICNEVEIHFKRSN